MAMDWSTKLEFDRIMSQGDWHMSHGEDRERNCYWSDAKNHYYYAMQSYQKAYDIARRAEDYSQNQSNEKYQYASRCFREITYKADSHFKR